MSDFFLSQSALKDLERDTSCPAKWQATWVTGEVINVATDPMNNGSYGEYLCLGGGAPGRSTITDLPRLKNGDKSVVQLRIEEQAERFNQLFFQENHPEYLGFKILGKQLQLENGKNRGVIDFDAVNLVEGETWIFDLKFTGSMPRIWGDLYEKDFIQLTHYRDLYEFNFGILPRVGIIVFDYSPRKEIKFIELQISKQKVDEKNLRFGAAWDAINEYTKRGWARIPNLEECSTCPLVCSKRASTEQIVYETIVY